MKCPSGKHVHPTRQAANDALAVRRSQGSRERYSYRCPLCFGFHLTSNRPRRRKRRSR